MHMRLITEHENLEGAYVLLRSSLNVPLVDGAVGDRFRLEQALPTMRYLSAAGAKVIVVGHIGREVTETLKPVYDALVDAIDLTWGGAVTEQNFMEARDAMQPGDILLAENLRQNPGEKENNSEFAQLLASLADVYVNDAFSVCHREHASMVGVPALLPAYAGLTLREEVTHLREVMQPEHPALFILGGAKFDTKMPLIEKYLELYDHVFVGGALANDILKARGYAVGKSLLSEIELSKSLANHLKILVPVDLEVDGPRGRHVCELDEVKDDETILDAGPKTVDLLAPYIKDAKTVVWNGPLGNYEVGFTTATEEVAKLLAAADGFSVIGGGDTVAATERLGLHDQFEFVSTGGGAMLAFLEHGTTPALEALEQSA